MTWIIKNMWDSPFALGESLFHTVTEQGGVFDGMPHGYRITVK